MGIASIEGAAPSVSAALAKARCEANIDLRTTAKESLAGGRRRGGRSDEVGVEQDPRRNDARRRRRRRVRNYPRGKEIYENVCRRLDQPGRLPAQLKVCGAVRAAVVLELRERLELRRLATAVARRRHRRHAATVHDAAREGETRLREPQEGEHHERDSANESSVYQGIGPPFYTGLRLVAWRFAHLHAGSVQNATPGSPRCPTRHDGRHHGPDDGLDDGPWLARCPGSGRSRCSGRRLARTQFRPRPRACGRRRRHCVKDRAWSAGRRGAVALVAVAATAVMHFGMGCCA